jgi:hypothetical protein
LIALRYLAYIFFFFCFFPYIDLINLGTDTQPMALFFAAVLLFSIKNKRLNKSIILLWLLFIMALLLSFRSELSGFQTVKNVLNYLSPPMICFAAYTVFIKMGLRVHFKLFLTIVLTYFIVGFVQLNIYPNFMAFLVNQGARGIMLGGRGVVSLCPEPAFYGSICLFFIVYALINFKRNQNLLLVSLLLIQLLFFSKTATAIGILALSVVIFGIVQMLRFRVRYFLLSGILIIGAVLFLQKIEKNPEENRVSILMVKFAKDPLLLSKLDVSAGVRLTSSLAPALSLANNYFLPMGMGTYKRFLKSLYREGKYPNLISKWVLFESNRLGGGINMVLFHLGFLGLIFPLAIYLAFKGLLKEDHQLFAFILFIALLFTQIQLMQAMIGFIIASALINSKIRRAGQISIVND